MLDFDYHPTNYEICSWLKHKECKIFSVSSLGIIIVKAEKIIDDQTIILTTEIRKKGVWYSYIGGLCCDGIVIVVVVKEIKIYEGQWLSLEAKGENVGY